MKRAILQLNSRNRLICWSVMAVCIVFTLLWQLQRGIEVDSNILGLLPSAERKENVQTALDTFSAGFSKNIAVLVKGENFTETSESAKLIAGSMLQSGLFNRVDYQISDDHAVSLYQHYYPHRAGLLSAEDSQLLLSRNFSDIKKQAQTALYNPASPLTSSMLKNDPLFLFVRFLDGLGSDSSNLKLQQGMLSAEVGNAVYVLINTELSQSPFNLDRQREINELLERLDQQAVNHNVSLIPAGMPLHAISSTNLAKHEITVIGGGSVLGILVLLFIVFRSVRPLVIALLPITLGVIAAFTICTLVFGRVHVMSLVFGASLIGVSIDYSFHYFSEQLCQDKSWQSDDGLRHIFPGITFGLLTSLIGYLALYIAPFPGLHQMALFSSVGLLTAYLTVVCLYPYLLKGTHQYPSKPVWLLVNSLVIPWEFLSRKRLLLPFLVVISIVLVLPLADLESDDDIRLLRNTPEMVLEKEHAFAEIIGRRASSSFFLVTGTSPEQVLKTEERLVSQLSSLEQHVSLHAISQSLPSLETQSLHRQSVLEALSQENSILLSYLKDLGFEDKTIQIYLDQYRPSNSQGLDFESWQQSPIADMYRHQWIESHDGSSASIILLYDIQAPGVLPSIAESLDGVTYVDQVTDISNVFKIYRELAVKAVLGAYFFIFMLLIYRYRIKKACLVILPPLLAAAFSLGVNSMLGQAINLFSILALLLVMAIGIDYTIFFAECQSSRRRTALAVMLSCITTILAFGLLALSATPAIFSFGITVGSGIVFAFLFSPIAALSDQNKEESLMANQLSK